MGREPWKLLFLKDKLNRKVRFPICGAMVPERPMWERFKEVTLRCLAPHLIPTQLQTGVEVDQFLAKILLGSVIWPLRARRADWSVVMLVLTATAELAIKQCTNNNTKKTEKEEISMSFYFLSVGWYVRPTTIVSNKCGWMMFLYMEISTVVELRRKRRGWLNQHSKLFFCGLRLYKKKIGKRTTFCFCFFFFFSLAEKKDAW